MVAGRHRTWVNNGKFYDLMSGAQEQSTIPEVQKKLEATCHAEFGKTLIALPSHRWTAYGLTFGVRREDALAVFRTLRDDPSFRFDMLIDLTCVDWMDRREPRFDVIYHLLSLKYLHRLCIRIEVDEDSPEVDSVVKLWPTANFLEREVWDMFGVSFAGHGDLRRILLYDEFVGHPLRKDYPLRGKQPRVPLRIPELRNTSADMIRGDLVSLPSRKREQRTG